MTEEFNESENNGKENGVYADCFRVGHSAYKLVFDFGQSSEGSGSKRFHTRIITGPETAKAFYVTLRESLDQYEEQFGSIATRE